MTSEDLDRIESALGITLPASYRRRVSPFPIPAAADNTDLGLWDDADRLIAYNRELRRGAPGGVPPWPSHFFAIGDPGDGSPFALDLRDESVWWVDHSGLDNAGTSREVESFDAWATEYITTLRSEMARDLVDPDGTPAARAKEERKSAIGGTIGCVLGLVLFLAVLFLLRTLVRWIS